MPVGKEPPYNQKGMRIRPAGERITCKDGFTISVQASRINYSEPRNDTGPYTCCEVGMPSHYDIFLQEYAEDPSNPTGTVYGYVPSDTIMMCIESHGGMVSGDLPPLEHTTAYMQARHED